MMQPLRLIYQRKFDFSFLALIAITLQYKFYEKILCDPMLSPDSGLLTIPLKNKK